MSTNTTEHDTLAEQSSDRPDDSREFPAERAFSAPSDAAGSPDLSVGWEAMIQIMHCETSSIDDSEVTSS